MILISGLQSCHGAPAPFVDLNGLPILESVQSALPSLESVQDAIDRAASYGYEMLGYGYPEHDHVIVKDKPTLWDGRISVPDFISPLIASMPDDYGMDLDGKRIVKGHDGRLGFRLAVPYFGDFQYIRELGPGRFTDKLGPGKYPYPGLEDRPSKDTGHHYGYGDPKPKDILYEHPKTTYAKSDYSGLANYPWNALNK